MLQMRKFLLSICVAGAVAESAMAGRIYARRDDHIMFARQATPSGSATTPAGSATAAPASGSSSAAVPVSSATTAETPSPTPLIYFHFVGTLQSCSAAQVTWEYDGPSGQTLDLNITNVHVEQPTSIPWIPNAPKVNQTDAIGNKTILVNDVVVTGLDASSGSYNWSPVKMRQGWFVLKGTINDDATYSPMFYIANGTDTACIPKPTPLPGTVVPKKKSDAGVIAGSVIGALVVALVAALALCLICRRRRTKRAKQDPSWAALKRSGSKGGISSRSSSMTKTAAGASVAGAAKHSRSNSLDPTEEMSPYKDTADGEKNDAPQSLPALHLVGGALDVPTSPNPFADSVSSSFSNRNSRTSILFDSNPFDDSSAIVPPSATRTSDGSVLYDFAPYSSPAPTRSRYSEDFGDSEARVTHPPPVPVRIPSTKEVEETEESPPTPRQANFRKPVVYNDEDVFADPMYADMDSEPARRSSFTSSANTSGMFTAQQSLADLNGSAIDLAKKSNLGDLGMGVKPVHSIIPDMPPLPKSEWA